MTASTVSVRQQGSTSMAERWFEEQGEYLYRFARSRVHGAADAEDLVQETLLAAIRSQHQFSNTSSERTWLTGILKHKIADHYRATFRTASTADENADAFFSIDGHWGGQEPSGYFDDLDRDRMLRSILTALAVIPRRLAIVFTLREIEGMSTSEICEFLKISNSNLHVLLHRARLHLRKALAT